MQTVVKTLKEFQAYKGAKGTFTKVARVEKRPGVEELKFQEDPYLFKGTLHESASREKLQNIVNKLHEQFEKKIYCDLKISFPIGSPFRNYGEIDNVFDEGKTELAHKPGEVLLVNIWLSWAPPCQNSMNHFQEMLEKNSETWKDRVRIIGASIDDSKKFLKEKIEQKKWDRVIHLILSGVIKDHPLLKDFNLPGFPFVCLVDKFGKINCAGHPKEIDLETRINELLEAESSEASEISKPAVSQTLGSNEEAEKMLVSLKKQNLEQFLKSFYLCSLAYEVTETLENQSISLKLNIKATILEGDAAALQSLNNFFGQFKGSELKIETVKYLDVPSDENPKCWKCASALHYPFYWLRWEEGKKFGCRECVEAKSTEEGHHFAYEQNSILLIGKWDKIAEKGMGNNIQPKDLQSLTNSFGYACSSCFASTCQMGDPRYVCLGCGADPDPKGIYVIFCTLCMQKLMKGDAQMLEALKPDNHFPSHPFLRILYSTGDYSNY